MNATDVIGWIVDNTYYCTSCSPTNDTNEHATPIFGDSETDSFSHCADCEELIPETLTSDGWKDVEERFERYLWQRAGRPEILKQWAEHVSPGDEETKRLIELVKKACDYEIQKERRNG
jgi:hypothetical protein